LSSLTLFKFFSFIIFILLSAFFSSAETAFTAINRLKLRSLIENNIKGAAQLEVILKNPKKLLTAILIGNNLANIGASALATTVLLDMLHSFNLFNYATNMAIITGIMTFILLTFGEITPKTIAIKKAESFALFVRKPLLIILFIFHPLICFFNFISVVISKLFGISSEMGEILTADEIKAIIKISEEEGILEKEEQEMIKSIFEFSDTIVREIMTPRTDAVCMEINSTIAEVIQLIINKGHSRIPVFDDKIDNIVGIIYAKDLLGAKDNDNSSNLKTHIREAVFIPETKNIEDLLQQMKKSQFHMAIVIDEHGGMAGLVTLEDIIEEIFGEIQDEYDTPEKPAFRELSSNHFTIDARMNMDDISDKLDFSFPQDEDDYDTIGGFVLSQLGKLPISGEKIQYKNLEIIVKKIRKRRILRLEIIRHQIDTDQETAQNSH
jgi:putative hemolysin